MGSPHYLDGLELLLYVFFANLLQKVISMESQQIHLFNSIFLALSLAP